MGTSYDVKSYELAEHFLADYACLPHIREGEAHRLAMAIQRAIEDELERSRDAGEIVPR